MKTHLRRTCPALVGLKFMDAPALLRLANHALQPKLGVPGDLHLFYSRVPEPAMELPFRL